MFLKIITSYNSIIKNNKIYIKKVSKQFIAIEIMFKIPIIIIIITCIKVYVKVKTLTLIYLKKFIIEIIMMDIRYMKYIMTENCGDFIVYNDIIQLLNKIPSGGKYEKIIIISNVFSNCNDVYNCCECRK